MSGEGPVWDDLARRASAIVGEEEPLRLALPGDAGRLFVDHAGPVLAVHRCAGTSTGDPSVDRRAACSEAHRLVTSQPAYLLASVEPEQQEGLRRLADSTARALAAQSGGLLVVEVWISMHESDSEADPFKRTPGFTLFAPETPAAQAAGAALADALSGIEIAGQGADVACITAGEIAPPGLRPLCAASDAPIAVLGLAVDAVFLNERDDEFYPRVLDALRGALSPALTAAAAAYAEALGTDARPLGRRHLEPAAEAVDRGLAEVARQYGFLLQVTPINTAAAWADFREGGCDREPELLYRPLTFDPDAIRRDLFALPVGEIEDPVVAGLLREKRDEVANEIQMILDRGTPAFVGGSLKMFGPCDGDLVSLAEKVLDALPERRARTGTEMVGATAFAAEAARELDHYRAQHDGFGSSVEVRDDIPGSLMVSRGQLLVGAAASVPAHRVRPLLAHEVGTHVLTYYNGCAQPLRQLRHGLAGYEDLQEGLAVLAEWLVGGLTAARMRTLAARVLGADALLGGAGFVEAFRAVRDRARLSDRRAFGVVVRIYRGGGLTKDMVYLRGLRDLLAHLAAGGAYWPLFVGKVALGHLGAVEALRARGVLREPPLRPRYATDPDALARLGRARAGLSVLDLIPRRQYRRP